MFSNGTEYMIFLNDYCERCKRYKPDEVDIRRACRTEFKISQVCITGEKKDFPYKDLERIGFSYRCKRFIGKRERVEKTTEKPMKGQLTF